jgi:hypothetical protein
MDIEWCTQAIRKNKKRKASSSPKDDDELQLQSNSEEHLQDEYNIDEEQLEMDIGWCTQATRKNKKRKASNTPKEDDERQLQSNSQGHSSNRNVESTGKPPPSIIIQDVTKYDLLKSSLEKQHINASIKIINNKNVKINLKSLNYYKKIARQLTEAGNTW